MPWHSLPCTWGKTGMRCRNCGKKNLANIQSIRAHLRFCPSRPDSQESDSETSGLSVAEKEWPPVPYTAIDLVDGAAKLEQVGLNLGIGPRAARVVSNYLSYCADLDDVWSMWEHMQHCSELRDPEKLRWLHTWCSKTGIDAEDWKEEVLAAYRRHWNKV